MSLSEAELIYDWNREQGGPRLGGRPEVLDLTLWEAAHAAGCHQPSLAERSALLHRMNELKLELACLGSTRPAFWPEAQALLSEAAESRLAIRPACLCRPLRSDLEQLLDLAESLGQAPSVLLEAGFSPLETWKGEEHLRVALARLREAALFASGNGLKVTLMLGDAALCPPDLLVRVLAECVEGAARVALVDTTGWATPEGTARVVRFLQEALRRCGRELPVDWHGYNDRGLALPNALTAMVAGASRIYASALGLSERAGCVPLELLLVNLRLLGAIDRPLEGLGPYCRQVAEAHQIELLPNHPVVGQDAFRTGTGVHAAAIVKAERKGHAWLADLIYSGVPAALFGCQQVIEVGPMAGESNVLHWLGRHGLEATAERVERILTAAKASDHVLSDREIRAALGETAEVG